MTDGTIASRGRFEPPSETDPAVRSVEEHARPVAGPDDLEDLIEYLADADCVMLGEASHGTSEFYRWRARVTAELLSEHDFSFVAVEGDWTSCYEVNRYVKGLTEGEVAGRDVVEAFERWPTWMWANWEVVEFLDWLRLENEAAGEPAGFYGLDVYGLYESMNAVVEYLEDVDPEAAEGAREAYRCFEPYGEDAQAYARAQRMVPESCEREVLEVLTDLRENAPEYGSEHPDDLFDAEQNALVAKNAEEYYRAMVGGEEDSWNVRDEHMIETLTRLLDHHGTGSKAIVWAHNTHVGDARATDMPRKGRVNIGQLARERDAVGDVALVGFGSHRGSVIAGEEWGAQMEEMDVPDGKDGSHEDVFHRAGGENRLLFSEDLPPGSPLEEARGHRAIGVVYRPALEAGNYVPTTLPERYDAFLHLEETEALHPLGIHSERERVPELYPYGL